MRLAALGLLCGASTASAGPCLVPGLSPEALTPGDAAIDQLGGVVIAAVPDAGGISTDPVVQPWEFVEGTARTTAKVTRLAPGLAIYAPKRGGERLGLEDAKGHTVVAVSYRFQQLDDMPMDEAPRPTGILHTRKVPRFRSESTIATLSSPPPAGTVALIVRDARSQSGQARSFVQITDPTTTSVEIYLRDRCRPEVPKTIATRAGDRVKLAWVDAEGHVSLWSAAIEVKAR
ncbi:hypothetical protein BH11MYX3_BH11MYX3_08690 [soil metagenome]